MKEVWEKHNGKKAKRRRIEEIKEREQRYKRKMKEMRDMRRELEEEVYTDEEENKNDENDYSDGNEPIRPSKRGKKCKNGSGKLVIGQFYEKSCSEYIQEYMKEDVWYSKNEIGKLLTDNGKVYKCYKKNIGTLASKEILEKSSKNGNDRVMRYRKKKPRGRGG